MSTQLQHTPGPWTRDDSVHPYDVNILDANGFRIAKVEATPILSGYSEKLGIDHWADAPGTAYIERTADELNANVSLIEAAPDMLAALEQMNALMENLFEAVDWAKTFRLDVVALNEAPLAMKRAIAKARGDLEGQAQ